MRIAARAQEKHASHLRAMTRFMLIAFRLRFAEETVEDAHGTGAHTTPDSRVTAYSKDVAVIVCVIR